MENLAVCEAELTDVKNHLAHTLSRRTRMTLPGTHKVIEELYCKVGHLSLDQFLQFLQCTH